MSITRAQYAISCLGSLGNVLPSMGTEQFIINWTGLESAPPGAKNNLLNCTQRLPGSSAFNHLSGGLGVQNYPTLGLGALAFSVTLRNGLYPSLLRALLMNDETALGMKTGQPSAGVGHDLGVWSGGTRYNPAQRPTNGNDVFSWSGVVTTAGPSSPPVAPVAPRPQITTTTVKSMSNPAPGAAPAGTTPSTYQVPQSNTGIAPVDAAINSIGTIFKPLLIVSNAISGISNWTNNPTRILKLAAGILLFLFGLAVLFTDVFEAFSKTGVGQAVGSAVKTAGAAAAA